MAPALASCPAPIPPSLAQLPTFAERSTRRFLFLKDRMKKICITALDDGTFEVEPYGEPEPQGGEMGQPDMSEDMQEGSAYQSLEEALAAAGEMLGGAGESEPMMEGEEEFTQGFKSVRGTPEEQMQFRK